MKNTIIIALIAILLIFTVSAERLKYDCNGDGSFNEGDIILGDYDGDCEIGTTDLSAINLMIHRPAQYPYLEFMDMDGDGNIDEIDEGIVAGKLVHCHDYDGDWYYSCAGTTSSFSGQSDCNDDDDTINPGASENSYFDETDQDCNGIEMRIFGEVSTSLYGLYHAIIEVWVNDNLDSSVLTENNKDSTYGYYETYSNTPGSAYVKFSKPGFIPQQNPDFINGAGSISQDATLQQDNAVAGSITGTVKELSSGDVYAVLSIQNDDTEDIIQIVESDYGTYTVFGLVETPIAGTYSIVDGYVNVEGSLFSCDVFFGDGISVVKGGTTTRNIWLDCGFA